MAVPLHQFHVVRLFRAHTACDGWSALARRHQNNGPGLHGTHTTYQRRPQLAVLYQFNDAGLHRADTACVG